MTFRDRVAVITGAGAGIGQALAIELADRGCHLALTDLHVERLEAVSHAVAARGRRVSVHGFDVADRSAWPPFVEAVLEAHSNIHIAVNNAGVSLCGPFSECSLDDIEWQLGVNLWGVIHGCHFLLPVLRRQESAHLVNLSSLFGLISVPDNAAYCMSKHAVRSLSETLEMELADTSVRVHCVHPGAIATQIASDARFRGEGLTGGPSVAVGLIGKGMKPETAARIIADGIAADRRRIVVGRDAKALSLLQWSLPVRYRPLMVRFLKRQRANVPPTASPSEGGHEHEGGPGDSDA